MPSDILTMPAERVDTLGTIELVRALEQRPCECTRGARHEECVGPVDRWWRRLVLGVDDEDAA